MFLAVDKTKLHLLRYFGLHRIPFPTTMVVVFVARRWVLSQLSAVEMEEDNAGRSSLVTEIATGK